MIEIKILAKNGSCNLSDDVEVSLWIDRVVYDATTTTWADVQSAVNGFREYLESTTPKEPESLTKSVDRYLATTHGGK